MKPKAKTSHSSRGGTSKDDGSVMVISPRGKVTSQEQAEVLAALKDTLLDITKGLSLQEILENISVRAISLLHANGGGMYINEPEKKQVRCVVSYKTQRDYRGTVLPYGEGAAGRVAETGKSLLIKDYATWSGRAAVYEEDHPFHAVICVPMKWQGKVTGALTALRDTQFTRKELALLALFADHAAVAVENARLHLSVEQEHGKRQRTEEALQAREEQYQNLFENMAEGYAYCRMIYKGRRAVDWEYLAVNPSFETLTGLKDAVGKRVSELIPDLYKTDPKLYEIYGRVSRTGKAEKFELFIDALGNWYSVSVYSPKRDYFMAVFDVITERKRAEDALRQGEAQTRELFEVARRQSQELKLLDKVRTAMAQETELGALLRRVVESISEVFGYTLVSLYLLEEHDLILQHQVGYHRVIPKIPMDRGVTGRVVRTGQAVFLPDVRTDQDFLEAIEDIVSEICVPLVVNGETVGVLNVESTNGVHLTEADLAWISALSVHVGMSISRAWLFEDLRGRNQVLSALQESTLALMEQTQLSETLRTIIEQAAQLGNTHNGYIYLVQPGGKEIELILGLGAFEKYQGQRLQPGEGLAGKVWQDAAPLHVRNYTAWQGRSNKYDSTQFQAVVGVPLIFRGKVTGILGLAQLEPHRVFNENDVEVLRYFSRLAAIALENAGLFTSLQKELQERTQAEDSLRRAEAKYRDLVERLPLIVYTSELGKDGRWFYASPQIEGLLGFSVQEWLSDPDLWYNQIHPEDRERQESIEEDCGRTGQPFESEYRIFARDGRELWVRDSGHIVPNRNGNIPVVQGVLQDITDRKHSERVQFAVNQIADAAQATDELPDFYEAVHQILCGLMPAENFYITLYDSANDLFEVVYRHDEIDYPKEWLTYKPGKGIGAYILRTGKPILSTPETFEQLEKNGEVEILATRMVDYIGVPLKSGQNIIGVMAIQTYNLSRRLSEKDLGMMVFVSTQVATTIERKRAKAALRESETRYRLLIDSSPTAIALHQNGRIVFVNDAATRLMRARHADDLIGKPIMELVHPDYRPIVAKRVHEAEAENRPGAVLEEKFLRLDGTVVDVEVSSAALLYKGAPAVQVIVHDITERKRSEKIQQSLYEIARAGMLTQSLDELYAKIHAVLQELLPTQYFYIAIYDQGNNLVSFPYFQDPFDFAPPPSAPGRGLTEYVLRTREPVLATREIADQLIQKGEIELIGADSIEWLGVPLITQDQAIGVMVTQTYDESVHFSQQDVEIMKYVSTQVASAIERKRSEDALRRSEAFTRSIVENEPECVKILGPGGVLQYMNPAGLAIIECEDLELVKGQSVYSIVVPEHRQAFQDLTEHVLNGETGSLQFEVIGLRGTRRWLDTHAVPLFNQQGQVDSLLGITRDITDRKQAEALQDAVYRITQAAQMTDSITDLFPQIHQIISSVMPAENFFITLYDESRNVLEFPYFKDVLDEPFLPNIEPGMGLTAYVLRTRRSLLCTQEVHDELERQGAVKLLGVPSKIWLGVPLLVEGRAIGVMVVQHYTDPDAYGEREQYMLEFVSSQIATTIRRKQAEQALRESESRYRSLVTGTLDGVYRSTHDGRFIEVNPAMVHMFGYESREELLGVDIKRDLYFAPEERESLFLDTGQEKVDIFRMRRKDGSEIWVEDHGHYVHDPAGNVIYHEGILRDVTERIRAEREIGRLLIESQQRLRHVEALRSIDLAIGSSMDLRTTLNILLSYVKSLLAVDAVDILLFNRNTQAFEFAAGNGFHSRVSDTAFQAMGRSFASRAALERRIIQFHNPVEVHANRDLSALWKAEGFITYTGAPLIAKGDFKGVLEIHHRSMFHADPQWTDLVQNFSTQAAIAIENAQLFNDLQNTNFELSLAYDATIEGWSRAMELRGNEPAGHYQRVTELTLLLARAMGIRDADLVHVRRGALLHDIGKMAIPDSILRKTEPLTQEDWEIVRQHPKHARELLEPISYLRAAIDIPIYHHEKWDGTGYPYGLKGEEIPLSARVFAVADVYDTSMSDVFHRKGISREKVIEHIKEESGSHFDPAVVGTFLQLLAKGQLVL